MSMMDETIGFKSTAGRSVRFCDSTESKIKPLERPTTVLPNVAAHWKDANLVKRISLRIQLLSGESPVRFVHWRVSTDQKSFIVGVTLDDSFMTPEQAFHCHTLAGIKDQHEHRMLKMVLEHHPKTIAYREAISTQELLRCLVVLDGFFLLLEGLLLKVLDDFSSWRMVTIDISSCESTSGFESSTFFGWCSNTIFHIRCSCWSLLPARV
jgi:hypothetical protein